MYEKLKDEQIVLEITTLIENAERLHDEYCEYCEFMRAVFLNTSGLN